MNTSPSTPKARGRRLRDRLVERQGTENQRLVRERALWNHLLLFDDDLRETALAIGSIEGFLARTMSTLERENVTRAELEELAEDLDVERQVTALDETLASLRRRLQVIAYSLR